MAQIPDLPSAITPVSNSDETIIRQSDGSDHRVAVSDLVTPVAQTVAYTVAPMPWAEGVVNAAYQRRLYTPDDGVPEIYYSTSDQTMGATPVLPDFIPYGNAIEVVAEGSTTNTTVALAERFGQILSIKDFGAKGDGVTDDYTAFNNMRMACNDNTSGKPLVVHIPAGTYVIGTALGNFNKSIVFVGDGSKASRLHFTNDVRGFYFYASDAADEDYYCHVEGISLYKEGSTNQNSFYVVNSTDYEVKSSEVYVNDVVIDVLDDEDEWGNGLYCTSIGKVTVKDYSYTGGASRSVYNTNLTPTGLVLNTCGQSNLSNIVVNNAGKGLQLTSTTTTTSVTGFVASSCVYGIDSSLYSGELKLSSCFVSVYEKGIRLYNETYGHIPSQLNNITCTVLSPTTTGRVNTIYGVELLASYSTIDNIYIQSSALPSVSFQGLALHDAGTYSSNLLFNNVKTPVYVLNKTTSTSGCGAVINGVQAVGYTESTVVTGDLTNTNISNWYSSSAANNSVASDFAFYHTSGAESLRVKGNVVDFNKGGYAAHTYWDVHTLGSANDYDVRFYFSGGTDGTSGAGDLTVYANTFVTSCSTIRPFSSTSTKLGASGYRFTSGYFTALDTTSLAVSTVTVTGSLTVPTLNISSSILPTTDNTCTIGSSSLRFNHVYSVNVTSTNVYSGGFNASVHILPTVTDTVPVGSANYRFSAGYFKSVYADTGVCTNLYPSTTGTGSVGTLTAKYATGYINSLYSPAITLYDGGSIHPLSNNQCSLGTSSLYFNHTYTQNITVGNTINVTSNVVPLTDNTGTLGNSSKRFNHTYSTNVTSTTINAANMYVTGGFYPTTNEVGALGSSTQRFGATYSKMMYCDSLRAETSIYPLTTNTGTLGTSSLYFNHTYSTNVTSTTINAANMYVTGRFYPTTNEVGSLGSSSLRFSAAYSKMVYCDSLSAATSIYPTTTGTGSVGTSSYKFSEGYINRLNCSTYVGGASFVNSSYTTLLDIVDGGFYEFNRGLGSTSCNLDFHSGTKTTANNYDARLNFDGGTEGTDGEGFCTFTLGVFITNCTRMRPYADNTTELGASNFRYSTGYFTTLNATSLTVSNVTVSSSLTVPTLNISSSVLPTTDNTRTIGSSSLRFNHTYSTNVTSTTINAANMYVTGGFYPTTNEVGALGSSSLRFSAAYSKMMYCDSLRATTSIYPTTTGTGSVGTSSYKFSEGYINRLNCSTYVGGASFVNSSYTTLLDIVDGGFYEFNRGLGSTSCNLDFHSGTKTTANNYDARLSFYGGTEGTDGEGYCTFSLGVFITNCTRMRPDVDNTTIFGASNFRYSAGYFTTLYTTNLAATALTGNITMGTGSTYYIGSETSKLKGLFVDGITTTTMSGFTVSSAIHTLAEANIGAAAARFGTIYSINLDANNIFVNSTIQPDDDLGATVGSSTKRFSTGYFSRIEVTTLYLRNTYPNNLTGTVGVDENSFLKMYYI